VVAIPNWPPFSVQTAMTPVPPGVTGTFTATGAMILARARHRMTVLVDGRVLCTGGEHDAPLGRVLQQAELFDPLTYQWNFSMSLGNGINGMHYKRYGHTSTLLKDGRVLLTGGSDNHKILNVAELYDPKTDQFIVVQARMASCRVFHTAELLDNGNVVLIGGWENNLVSNASTAQGGGVSYILDSMEIYDIYAGTFTHTAQSMMPRVSYNANRIQYGQSPGVSTSAGRFYHTSSKLPDNTVMYCGGYGDPWLPQAFTMDDAQLFLPDSGGSGVNGLVRHCGTNLTVPRACHTATVLQTGDQAVEGVVIIAGGFTNSPYQGALQSTEMFDYKEISTTGIWANDKGCFAPIAMAMTSTRHNHTGSLVMNGAFKGGVLFTGGAQHLPVQNPNWPPPDPRLYPWLEPTGCGACRLTFSTDIWMPYGFGKYTTKPFRGLNITSSLGVTTDPQGNPTDLGSFYGAGVYLHQAVSFTNGVVLITGGSWCPFCMQGPNAWSTYFSANVGGWRAAAPSVIFNP
jgi:hypothetical protein